MDTLFGNLESGNTHKAAMLLHRLGRAYERVDVAQTRGEPRSTAFLALNPIGKIPVLVTDGDVVTESGAILFLLAHGTPLWPERPRDQTEVLRWMFFEQYSHEPALAVLRYLKKFTAQPELHAARIEELLPKARGALQAMNQRLERSDFLVGPCATIADYALYPYTKWADEAGIDVSTTPVARWLARVEALPRFLPLYADAAVRTIPFAAWAASGSEQTA